MVDDQLLPMCVFEYLFLISLRYSIRLQHQYSLAAAHANCDDCARALFFPIDHRYVSNSRFVFLLAFVLCIGASPL